VISVAPLPYATAPATVATTAAIQWAVRNSNNNRSTPEYSKEDGHEKMDNTHGRHMYDHPPVRR
jgi:hypothetical protein